MLSVAFPYQCSIAYPADSTARLHLRITTPVASGADWTCSVPAWVWRSLDAADLAALIAHRYPGPRTRQSALDSGRLLRAVGQALLAAGHHPTCCPQP